LRGFLEDTADWLQMTYPGYLLNPGDMFSVDPERVLFATGMKKPIKQGGKAKKAATEGEEATETQEEEAGEDAEAKASEAEVAEVESATQELNAAAAPEDAKKALRSLMDRAKRITTAAKGDLSGRRLKDLRKLSQNVRQAMSKFGTSKGKDMPVAETVEELTSVLTEITSKIPAEALPASEAPKKPTEGEGATTSSNPQAQDPVKEDKYRVAKDAQLLQQALQRARENPVDASKPYATPWRPRDYMSAFAFIPRYLEVNQNVCSAVYLRHPVARPGLAEVPSPLSAESAGLAFNWYLRRR
jgi:ribosomal protein S4